MTTESPFQDHDDPRELPPQDHYPLTDEDYDRYCGPEVEPEGDIPLTPVEVRRPLQLDGNSRHPRAPRPLLQLDGYSRHSRVPRAPAK